MRPRPTILAVPSYSDPSFSPSLQLPLCMSYAEDLRRQTGPLSTTIRFDHRELVGDLRLFKFQRHHPASDCLHASTTDAITYSHLVQIPVLPQCPVVVVFFCLFPCVPCTLAFVATLVSTMFSSLSSAVVSQLRPVCSFFFLQVTVKSASCCSTSHHRHHSLIH